MTDPKGVTIQCPHDDFGRLVEAQSPDFGLRRYVYDEAGNLVSERRGDGAVLTYQYDAANQQVAVKLGATTSESWNWNTPGASATDCASGTPLPAPLATGRLAHVSDATGHWYFGYWPNGRLRYEFPPQAYTFWTPTSFNTTARNTMTPSS